MSYNGTPLSSVVVMARLLPDYLETKRIVLRQPCDADAQLIFESYARDTEVPRFMTWRPHTVVTESEDFVRKCL